MSDPLREQRLADIARQAAVCADVVAEGYEAFMQPSRYGMLLRSQAERSLAIISEASKHLDPGFKAAAHPQIPWRKLTEMRNKISDENGQMDHDLVWDVMSDELPDLVHQFGITADPDPYSFD